MIVLTLVNDCSSTSTGKPPNYTYNFVLIGGIVCLMICTIAVEIGWICVLYFYRSKYSKVEEENPGLEEQIASLERQLNQRARYIFVRPNDDVPPYTEGEQTTQQ